jgi:hypothetical protein
LLKTAAGKIFSNYIIDNQLVIIKKYHKNITLLSRVFFIMCCGFTSGLLPVYFRFASGLLLTTSGIFRFFSEPETWFSLINFVQQ